MYAYCSLKQVLKIKTMLLWLLTLLTIGGSMAESAISFQTQTIYFEQDYVLYAASCNGTLYTLHNSGLYAMSGSENKEMPLIAAEKLPQRIDSLLADDHGVYVITTENGLEVRMSVDRSGNEVHRLCFADSEVSGIRNPKILNGKLYFLSDNGARPEIVVCSMQTHETLTIPASDILEFDLSADGDIFALKQKTQWPEVVTSIERIHPETGEVSVWAEFNADQPLNRLTFDTAADTVYLFGRNEIFSVSVGGTLKRQDSFPAGDVISVCLLPKGIALIVDDMLVIRNFDESAERKKTAITILDPEGRGENYRGFIQSHPKFDIRFVHSGIKTSK